MARPWRRAWRSARRTFPDRPLVALGGLAGGLALGLGLAIILETQDKSIYNEKDAAFCLELPVWGMLPVLDSVTGNRAHVHRWKRRRRTGPIERQPEGA